MNTYYFMEQMPHYSFVKGISWDDIDIQIEFIKKKNSGEFYFYKQVSNETDLVSGCSGPSEKITEVHRKMSEFGMGRLDLYSSRYQEAKTFGRHYDEDNVLIVQSFGKMLYEFDNGDVVTLKPGDALLIPKFVHHNPIHIEPRITCSFSK